MSRFIFKLEPVLRARQAIQRQQQRSVARLERQRVVLEQKLRHQQECLRAGQEALRERLVGAVDTDQLRLHAKSALAVHQELQSARVELLEARKQCLAIEITRQRRYEVWQQEQTRKEQANLDDLSSNIKRREESLI
jgi:flagellar biosynthesis chaperone FliJ